MYKFFLLFIVFIFLGACQAAKDGLTQKKRSNADEFLVEKKNPLVLPPNFGELPTPGSVKANIKDNASNEIKSLLSKDDSTINQSKNGTTSIESSVLKKIKNK